MRLSACSGNYAPTRLPQRFATPRSQMVRLCGRLQGQFTFNVITFVSNLNITGMTLSLSITEDPGIR